MDRLDGGEVVTAAADEAPFPLKQKFYRHILPLMAVLVVASVAMSVYRGGQLLEEVYLQVAQARAQAIAHTMARQHSAEWQALVTTLPQDAVPHMAADHPLRRALEGTLIDARLAKLKIYDRQGRLLFSTDTEQAGQVDLAPELRDLLEDRQPKIELKGEAGERLYEIYVWLPDADGNIGEIFELYEPAEFLNAMLLANVLPQIILPLGVMGGLTLLLWRMVTRAQRQLDQRDSVLQGLRQRLERLVSSQALGAARRAEGDALASQVLDVTLFYSDIRSFTSYAEDHPPQTVVAFLNQVMTVQIRAIHRHGGDVDKMIGDALLAVFDGPDRAARAVSCAIEVQHEIALLENLPRRIGIGLHDGFVIAGTIGPPERQDFTVIGDAVNVAARLCSESGGAEVVADTRTLARAGHPEGFGAVEQISVKGRGEPLRIRRWHSDN